MCVCVRVRACVCVRVHVCVCVYQRERASEQEVVFTVAAVGAEVVFTVGYRLPDITREVVFTVGCRLPVRL